MLSEGSASARVHGSVASVQVQPVPLMAVGTGGLVTFGSVSVTVTVPTVGPKPTLLTVMVHCAPVWPRLNVPLWVLVIVGSGASTSMVAVAWLPEPAFAEVTVPVVLTLCPPLVPVTLIENVQEPPAVIVPFARLTTEKPETVPVVIVPAPHEPVSPFGFGIVKPAGSVSPKPTPVSATVAFGFVMVKVSVVVSFKLMLAAPNAFAMLGGPITVMLAVLLVAPAPLSFDEIGPVVLFCTPACTPVTFRLIVHEPFAASDPPVRLIEPDPAAAVVVPPQLLVRPFGVATTRPAGSVSLKVTPVSPIDAFGLLMLKVSDVLAFSRMLAAPKAFVIVGGVATVRLAVAVLPVPPLVEVTLPVVLVNWPAAAPVTVTEKVHWPPTATDAPASEMLVGFVVVSVPPQTVDVPLATVSPVGSVSLKATPASAAVLPAGLVMVNVSEVVAFSAILLGLNTLAIDGGATTCSRAVLLAVPVPPSVELTAPVVLLASPATVPFTSTLIVHDVLWATLPPERLITPVPAVAVPVPPHVLLTVGVAETTRVAEPGPLLTGSVSLNATPVRSPSAGVAGLFGLLMVKVTVVVPFRGMLAAPKAFAIVGGATTVIEAVAVALVPPSVELTTTLLFLVPAVVPCTLTVTAQLALAATVPPDRKST